MSLFPYIIAEPEEKQVTASERLIYRTFVAIVDSDPPTSTARAVVRTAKRCGVSRSRVLEIIRTVNSYYLDFEEPQHGTDHR